MPDFEFEQCQNYDLLDIIAVSNETRRQLREPPTQEDVP